VSQITIRRKRLVYGADGSMTQSYITETHNWPSMTCGQFKRSFPDAVVSINHSIEDHAESEHRFRGSYHKAEPKVAMPEKGAFDLAGLINEEVAKL